MKTFKIAGINFDHMHMGDLLRKCHEHPEVEIAGICDDNPARMQAAIANFSIYLELHETRDFSVRTVPPSAHECRS